MTYGQTKATELATRVEEIIRDARRVGDDLGDGAFRSAATTLEVVRDLLRSRAGRTPQ